MPNRKKISTEGEIHHVFTKSIAGFKIFNTADDFSRLIKTLAFYAVENPPCRFSWSEEAKGKQQIVCDGQDSDRIVDMLSYCIMPTHIHLILAARKENGISKFMNRGLMSYSKYFNVKHKRKGPLWEGRFKNVAVETDEQLLHLTRYIHLNPVTARLVDKPEEWTYSSYKEYIQMHNGGTRLCSFQKYLECDQLGYQKFVEERIDDQRALARVKHLVLE